MNAAKAGILESLEKAGGVKLSVDDVKASPMGGYGSPVAFKLGKTLRRSPQDIASELAGRISPGGFIKSVQAVNGYINFTLDYEKVLERLLDGKDEVRHGRGTVILEHTSVNPTGPVHVGRIRNTIIGDSIRRILSHAGYEVKTHYYVNDIGKQVAIIASGLADRMEPDLELVKKYERYASRQDYQVFFTYVKANRLFEEDESFQRRVQAKIQAAEGGDGAALKEITSAAKRCLEGQLKTFERLGAKFDLFDLESELIVDGSVDKVMEKARKDMHYVKSDIGEGLDLSPFGVEKRGGMTVLARADGTSVYLARDIAYHLKKLKLGDRAINVLGEDHKMEFLELKTI
ncbi:MAG: arginine--tRNA ligase, partial [Candidatus Altiarchaeota archaeon]|nr:arginine--tRNA ligase [Candidatus Altiarchaeota archaeon]